MVSKIPLHTNDMMGEILYETLDDITKSIDEQYQKWSKSVNVILEKDNMDLSRTQAYRWLLVKEFWNGISNNRLISSQSKISLMSGLMEQLYVVSYDSPITHNYQREILSSIGVDRAKLIMDQDIANRIYDRFEAAKISIATLIGDEKVQFLTEEGFTQHAKSFQKSISSTKELLNDISDSTIILQNDVSEIIKQQIPAANRYISEMKSHVEASISDYSVKFDALKEEAASKFEELNSKLSAEITEKILEEPAQLWRGNADVHQTRAYISLAIALILGGFIAYAAPNIGLKAHRLASAELGDGNSGLGALIFSAVSAMIFVTFGIWATRVAVRFYMAEQHMKNDCINRAAITDVFIKLQATNNVGEGDRTHLLQSIMRPTQDGIVFDDGLPNGHPASYLVELINPLKKKE